MSSLLLRADASFTQSLHKMPKFTAEIRRTRIFTALYKRSIIDQKYLDQILPSFIYRLWVLVGIDMFFFLSFFLKEINNIPHAKQSSHSNRKEKRKITRPLHIMD